MAVLRQTDWLDGDQFPDLEFFASRAMSHDAGDHCVCCGAEQPDDLKWPAYELELQPKDGGESIAFEYRACPRCEAKLDALLDRLGAPK